MADMTKGVRLPGAVEWQSRAWGLERPPSSRNSDYAALHEGFSPKVEIGKGAFEIAVEGNGAAGALDRLSSRLKKVSMKDLKYE